MKNSTVLVLCAFILALCVSAPAFGQDKDEYRAVFSYDPPAEAPAGSNDVTFTVGGISYKTSNGIHWFAAPAFADLPEDMQESLTKILRSKGFGVKGPYESYDLMPFQDKKAIDLMLVPTVELTVVFKDHKEDAANMWQAGADQVQTGNAEVRGKIILKMNEIMTQEMMWSKTIPVKEFSFPYYIKVKFKEYKRIKESGHKGLYDYDPIFNGMAEGLEEQYPNIMGTIDTLIDPEEMDIIKKQCQEIKANKGY